MNWANKISILRIFLVPIFLYLFTGGTTGECHYILYSFFIFLVACITDFLDGYLARNVEKVTKFGKLIDPIADKLLVTACLLALLDARIISVWVALILIGRDIAVQGLRIVAASQGEVIAANSGGKLKTILQMVAIGTAIFIVMAKIETKPFGYLFYHRNTAFIRFFIDNSDNIVWTLMWSSAIISLYSAYGYFMNCKKINIF